MLAPRGGRVFLVKVEKADEQKVFLTGIVQFGGNGGRGCCTRPNFGHTRRSSSARCIEKPRASRRDGPVLWRGSRWHPSRQHILGMEKRSALLGGSASPSASSCLSPREGKRRLAEALLVPVAATERTVMPTDVTSGAAHLACVEQLGRA